MDFDKVTLDIDGAVAVLTLNDPEKLNAIDTAMLTGLREAIDRIAAESFPGRCLVFTGAGRGFSSGANLSEGLDGGQHDVPLGRRLETHYHPVLRRMRDLNIPIVTAVNGPAVGIGMSFAMMGDFIMVARSAYFMLSFCRIGLVPDGGATWLLPRIVGMQRAKEMAILGDKLPAEKAVEWGLANRMCEDDRLVSEAMTTAKKLAEGPKIAYGLMRKLFAASSDNTHEEQLSYEQQCQATAGRSLDFKEGIAAFLEKRSPKFEGR